MYNLDDTVLSEMEWSMIQKSEPQASNYSTVDNLQKSIQLIMCPQFHQVLDICCHSSCKEKNGFICNEIGCSHRLSHKSCPNKISVEGVIDMVSEKSRRIDQIKSKAIEFFDQKQKELQLLRSHIMNELDELKKAGYSDAEIKFIKEADFKTKDLQNNQMTAKERNTLFKNYELYVEKGRQAILQKATNHFDTFDNSLQSTIESLKLDFQQMKEDLKNPTQASFDTPSQKNIPKQVQPIKLPVRQKPSNIQRGRTFKRWTNLLSQESDRKTTIPSKQGNTSNLNNLSTQKSNNKSQNPNTPKGNSSSRKSNNSKQKVWK